MALQYTDGYAESVFSFANNINTVDGGTHLTGFRSALTRCMNGLRNSSLLQRQRGQLLRRGCTRGLTAIISVKLSDPQFESQTKAKLGNAELQGQVASIFGEAFSTWLEKEPAAKSDHQKATDTHLRVTPGRRADSCCAELLETSTLPGTNWPIAQSVAPVFRCSSSRASPQGQRSKGTRRRFQAILPCFARQDLERREKADGPRALGGIEIKALIQAMGCGISAASLTLGNLRYGKIIIMTDADVDAHIITLLLTFSSATWML